jgi:hypothetical protein
VRFKCFRKGSTTETHNYPKYTTFMWSFLSPWCLFILSPTRQQIVFSNEVQLLAKIAPHLYKHAVGFEIFDGNWHPLVYIRICIPGTLQYPVTIASGETAGVFRFQIPTVNRSRDVAKDENARAEVRSTIPEPRC